MMKKNIEKSQQSKTNAQTTLHDHHRNMMVILSIKFS